MVNERAIMPKPRKQQVTKKRTTTVSIEATNEDIELLKVYAAIQRTTVAALVKKAVDSMYGEALKNVPQPD